MQLHTRPGIEVIASRPLISFGGIPYHFHQLQSHTSCNPVSDLLARVSYRTLEF